VRWTFGRGLFGAFVFLCAAMLGSLQFARPTSAAPTEPFAAIADAGSRLSANPSLNAFGASRQVRLRFALPNDDIEFPVEVSGDPSSLTYEWVPVRDTVADTEARAVSGSSFITPSRPGFYRLALVRGSDRQIIPEPTLAVMVPFEEKTGSRLNGYKIGTYLAEKFGHHDHPAGFLEVHPSDVGLRVSTHLRLGDFITHDQQADVWPKYVALNPRLLDKLELILADVGGASRPELEIDVHSGFRSPDHNREVRRAASDSRHQYGDAADIQIDVNGDGKITMTDEIRVMLAVERVEEAHPDLVGGLGIYTSRRYRTPYLHIDTRGKRSRWRG